MWEDFKIKELDPDKEITCVITDKRFEPLIEPKQRIKVKENNIKIVFYAFNGTVLKGKVKDFLLLCDDLNISYPYRLYKEVN